LPVELLRRIGCLHCLPVLALAFLDFDCLGEFYEPFVQSLDVPLVLAVESKDGGVVFEYPVCG